MPRRPSAAKKLLLWSILALWTIVLFEALAAAYFLSGVSRVYYRPFYLEKRSDQWLWRTSHHPWGGWHKPSTTAYHLANCFSVEYTSNAHGARDRERSTTATAPRAVMLGDSFVEGYGVAEDKRLTNLLERHLGSEVLNFGMTHFGPLQYQLIYEQMVRQFDHELVIVGLLPNNDFLDNDADWGRKAPDFTRHYRPYYSESGGVFYPRSRPTPDEPSPFQRVHADETRRTGYSTKQKLLRLFWLYGLRLEVGHHVNVLPYLDPAYSYPGYLESNATRIARVTGSLLAIQKAGAPRSVLVLFLPDYKSWDYIEKHPEAYDKSVVPRMRDALETHGIKTIDLLQAFMARGLKKDALFLPCDGHWNNAGHQAAFDVVQPIVRDMLQAARGSRPTAAR